MKINIDKLQEITNELFSKLRQSVGEEIILNYDYYWDIGDEELYNPYEIPKDLTLGQLDEDWEFTEESFNTDTLLTHDFKRLSSILRAMSVKNVIWE